MLQEFLDANLLPITDETYFDKLKKSADELSKKLLKNKPKVLLYTLISIDPEVNADNPHVVEVKDLITKNWSTFSTNSKDTPVTFIRAVMLEALEIVSKETGFGGLIWLAARNLQRHLNLNGKEKELIVNFLWDLGKGNENKAIEIWSLPSESKVKKVIIELKQVLGVTVDPTELENHFKAASIHSGLGEGGENPQYPSNNATIWPIFFSQRASKGITEVINKAFANEGKKINENQTQIQETANKILNETHSQLLESNKLLEMRTQLLWWKESCYSDSLNQSYRGQQNGILQVVLAKDYSTFVPMLYPTSADYFLRETHRNLVKEDNKKLKMVDILSHVEKSATLLKSVFPEPSIEAGRTSLLNFIIGLIWNKYTQGNFKTTVGFDPAAEITLSDFTTWLFHDMQSSKISISK